MTTAAIVLREFFDLLLEWGARWWLQIMFWLGFGAAVGITTTLWIAHHLTP